MAIVVCVSGKKKSGKTTFVEKLVPALKSLGLRVGTVKHDAHSFDMDHEGKDSWRHARSGAETVVVSSPKRVAVIKRLKQEMPLAELVETFFADRDVVVAEGYWNSDMPRVEVFRSEAHEAPLMTKENAIEKKGLALVADIGWDAGVPLFGLDDGEGVARLIRESLLGQ